MSIPANPATQKQVPDHSIMDAYNKQVYLGNQFVYAVNMEILTSSETPLILLSNPAVLATAFPSGYEALFVCLNKLCCLTASQNAIIRVYLNPTVSVAGTAKTPVNLRNANPNTSIATLQLSPSVSANGTLIDVISALPGQQGISELLTILDPGQSMLITVQTTSNTTYVADVISWYEL